MKTPILKKNKTAGTKDAATRTKKVRFADDVDNSNKENKYTKMAKLAKGGAKKKKMKRLENGSKFQKEISAKKKHKVKVSPESNKTVGGLKQLWNKIKKPTKTGGMENEGKKRKKQASEDGGSPKKKLKSGKTSDLKNGEPTDAEEKVDWKKVKKERKELRTKRRSKGLQGKEVYEMSIRAKQIWEELRTEKCKGVQREVLAKELYNIIKGKVKQVIFAHDTCRVIECLMQVSSVDIKQGLFEELKNDIIELSKSKYAHFFVLKLLRYGTKEQRSYVMDKLHGNVATLMKHKVAADVVECAYNDHANAAQRAKMTQEFYGPEFMLFTDKLYNSLSEVLKEFPDKKEKILGNMKVQLEKAIDKGNLSHSILHALLADFMAYCTDKDRADIIESIRERLVFLLHTRDGARVAMRCLWFGTHKDRKVIVKSFKTHVQKIATDEHGHMVLQALLDCVDDTILVSKALFGELLSDVVSLANDEHGRKIIFHLVAPRNTSYTHPCVINILKEGDTNTMSKKESSVRQAEIKKAAIDPIMLTINEHINDFVWNNSRSIVLAAILTQGNADDDVTQLVYDKIIALVLKGEYETSLVEDPAGHLLLKKLIQHDKHRKEAGSQVLFSEMLLNSASERHLKYWLSCNRGAFMLLSMVEAKIPSVTSLVEEKLKSLQKFARSQSHKGGQLLVKKLW